MMTRRRKADGFLTLVPSKVSPISRQLRGDPSHTAYLSLRFYNEAKRRLLAVRSSIWRNLVLGDVLAINVDLPTQFFQFQTDPAKVEGFMRWLEKEVDEKVFDVGIGPERTFSVDQRWSDLYIKEAYGKGVVRAREELRKGGWLELQVGEEYTDRLMMPFHADRVGLLYIRTYETLRGVTDAMSHKIGEILAEGMALGLNPRTMAKEIYSEVDKIGLRRANLIARTEVMRAHHQATINEYREAGVEGVKVKAEWLTAGDEKVCPLCAALEGRVFTLDEIEPMIPLHPGCRCVSIPWLEPQKEIK